MIIKKKTALRKTTPRRIILKQAEPNLRVWVDPNFAGFNRRFRGNLGIRNLASINLNDNIESLRFNSTNANATLVLFSGRSYQGTFRVFKPSLTGVADLSDFDFEDETTSLIMANFALSTTDINTIQSTQLPPTNFAEILKIVIAGRIRRAAKRKRK